LSFISRGPSDLPSPTIGREQTDKTNLKQIINIVRILSRKDIIGSGPGSKKELWVEEVSPQ
jgi:hypothetical protein